jgi:hypothetical protein
MDNVYEPEIIQGKNVSAYKNAEFLALVTMTGRGLLMHDPRTSAQVLALDASPEVVGQAVGVHLSRSTVLSDQEFGKMFNSGAVQESVKSWENEVCKQFGQCNIKEINNTLEFAPTCHDRLDGWSGIHGVDDVVIPVGSSHEAVAAALNEAFSRCINKIA